LALPVSVVGTNFKDEYTKYVEMLEREEAEEAAARAAGRSSRKDKSVRNILGAMSQRLKNVGSSASIFEFSTHSMSDLVINLFPGNENEAENEAALDEQQQANEATCDILSPSDPRTTCADARTIHKSYASARIERALKKCRSAVAQHKQDKEKLNSSRKLRRGLSAKHARKIAALKAAALPLIAPQEYIFEREIRRHGAPNDDGRGASNVTKVRQCNDDI
jgi:hypothetical protein